MAHQIIIIDESRSISYMLLCVSVCGFIGAKESWVLFSIDQKPDFVNVNKIFQRLRQQTTEQQQKELTFYCIQKLFFYRPTFLQQMTRGKKYGLTCKV